MEATYRTFETDRLFLRPTTGEDAALVLAIFNSPKFLQYVGDRNLRNEADARQYIADKVTPQLERFGYANYTVIRRSDGVKLGTCGLYNRPEVLGVDLGFAFLPEFEKQGYAYEAAIKIREAGTEVFGLDTILAYTSVDNLDSQGLLKRLGFTFTGMMRFPDDDEELMLFLWKKTP